MNPIFLRFIVSMLFTLSVLGSISAETPYQKVDLGFGKWSQSWYADDFGDPMYDMPYIQTELKTIISKYSWRFFYIRFSIMPNVGDVFEMNIGADGDNIYVEGSNATIKIKDQNGNVSTLTVLVSNGSMYLGGDDVIGFGNLINSGNYTMAVTFHSYLDYGGKPETWSFKCTNETSAFWGAVDAAF